MRIAIVDSGIDQIHPSLKGCLVTGVSLEHRNGNLTTSSEFKDNIGHGTACAAIIHRDVPEAELVSVRIFRDELASDMALLCEAINWCTDNEIDLINLSLGVQTNNPPSELRSVCEQAYEHGIVVVAGANNNDLRREVYPAFFPIVFGVTSGKIRHHLSWGFLPNSPIEFIARGTLQRVAWRDGGHTIMCGTSIACAHFTAIVALEKVKEAVNDIELLKTSLIGGADKSIKPLQFPISGNRRVFLPALAGPVIKRDDLQRIGQKLFRSSDRLSWIRMAAVFPASEKELKTLLLFPHLRSVNINRFFDYPRAIRMKNVDTFQFAETLTRMPTDEEIDTFDTFVVGYFFDHPFQGNAEFGKDLLARVLKRDKKIFALDISVKHYIYNQLGRNKEIVYVPEIDEDLFSRVSLFRHLPKIRVPVIAVIGTGSQQGKFTVQMRIKEILGREGYKVSHLSTEPHGELLGADFTFPYGYKGTVLLRRERWVPLLNVVMRGIQEFNDPNVILTGTQMGVIPRGPATLGNETSSLDFIFGVQPDALVCAISPTDSVEFIKESVESAMVFSRAKTIFFTMIPRFQSYVKNENGRIVSERHFLNSEEKKERLGYFSQQLDAPVIDIMDLDNDKFVIESIQNFFA